MAELVIVTKGIPASPHPLGSHWVTIGRSEDNNFQIVENSVSSRHCEVRLHNDELIVRDLLSTNGTYIEGRKISEGVLKPNQKLRLGDVELELDITKPAAQEPPAPPTMPDKRSDTESLRKFRVLFVDDSMAFLETFGELCATYANKTWDIRQATTADKALATLQEQPVDLVMLDIGMPLVDGLQLLGIIRQRYPGIKIVVMTGSPSDSRRADALAKGAELFMEKPVTPEGCRMAFNMMNDLMSWSQREGFSGALRQVGLPDVIQMECIARHSTILEIRNAHTRGQIYIESGVITHATVGTMVGEKAVYRLLSLAGGEFQFKQFKAPPDRTVHGGWEHLLMEAARRVDEETAFIKKSGTQQHSNRASQSGADSNNEYRAMGEDIVESSNHSQSHKKPADNSPKS
jgi:CheY-like chemotaxis protein